jgi:hypothetical protein
MRGMPFAPKFEEESLTSEAIIAASHEVVLQLQDPSEVRSQDRMRDSRRE